VRLEVIEYAPRQPPNGWIVDVFDEGLEATRMGEVPEERALGWPDLQIRKCPTKPCQHDTDILAEYGPGFRLG
jgi:hypothetical protein